MLLRLGTGGCFGRGWMASSSPVIEDLPRGCRRGLLELIRTASVPALELVVPDPLRVAS